MYSIRELLPSHEEFAWFRNEPFFVFQERPTSVCRVMERKMKSNRPTVSETNITPTTLSNLPPAFQSEC